MELQKHTQDSMRIKDKLEEQKRKLRQARETIQVSRKFLTHRGFSLHTIGLFKRRFNDEENDDGDDDEMQEKYLRVANTPGEKAVEKV